MVVSSYDMITRVTTTKHYFFFHSFFFFFSVLVFHLISVFFFSFVVVVLSFYLYLPFSVCVCEIKWRKPSYDYIDNDDDYSTERRKKKHVKNSSKRVFVCKKRTWNTISFSSFDCCCWKKMNVDSVCVWFKLNFEKWFVCVCVFLGGSNSIH